MSPEMMAIIGVGVALLAAQLSVVGLLVTLMIQAEKRNIQRLDRLEDQMNRRFDAQDERVRSLEQGQARMDQRIQGLEQGQARMDQRIQGLEQGQAGLANEISGLKDLITHSSRPE